MFLYIDKNVEICNGCTIGGVKLNLIALRSHLAFHTVSNSCSIWSILYGEFRYDKSSQPFTFVEGECGSTP